MLVIAHHHINDPEAFWKAAKEETQHLPATLKVLGIYPSANTKMGTCLWEATSAEEVQAYLEKHTGNFAKNFCYEVNVAESMGLPVQQPELAHVN